MRVKEGEAIDLHPAIVKARCDSGQDLIATGMRQGAFRDILQGGWSTPVNIR